VILVEIVGSIILVEIVGSMRDFWLSLWARAPGPHGDSWVLKIGGGKPVLVDRCLTKEERNALEQKTEHFCPF
jgi:hypothetical protein